MDLTHKKVWGGNNSMKAGQLCCYIEDNEECPVRIFEKGDLEDNFFSKEEPFRSTVLH